jgi:hypothetical protein
LKGPLRWSKCSGSTFRLVDKATAAGWQPGWRVYGRVYVSRDTIADFKRRAASGEFAQVHKAPAKEAGVL